MLMAHYRNTLTAFWQQFPCYIGDISISLFHQQQTRTLDSELKTAIINLFHFYQQGVTLSDEPTDNYHPTLQLYKEF